MAETELMNSKWERRTELIGLDYYSASFILKYLSASIASFPRHWLMCVRPCRFTQVLQYNVGTLRII